MEYGLYTPFYEAKLTKKHHIRLNFNITFSGDNPLYNINIYIIYPQKRISIKQKRVEALYFSVRKQIFNLYS